jgi:hypothetical protein
VNPLNKCFLEQDGLLPLVAACASALILMLATVGAKAEDTETARLDLHSAVGQRLNERPSSARGGDARVGPEQRIRPV